MKLDFSTKKQVVKVNDKYAARYKKWWQFVIDNIGSYRVLIHFFIAILSDLKLHVVNRVQMTILINPLFIWLG